MKTDTFSQKVVLITGGSSGIGKAIGDYLTQHNFKVYGTSRNSTGKSSNFNLIDLDVTREDSIFKAVNLVLDKEGRIDILINNAGVGITGPLEETPTSEIRNAFETNFYGPINVCKAVLPAMRKKNNGLIINITSIAGYMGLPYRGIYSASKAALEIATEAFRMEVKGFNIKMTCVAPGDFATNIASGRYHVPVLEDSPYAKSYGDSLKLMNEHVDEGQDPEMMAKAVLKIIEEKEPKGHYKVGDLLQKASIVLKKLLPDKAYEKMLMNHYKL
ncbi:SDR family oxidoreductase [Zunongwangia sp. HRR-M8]|uniref:SDR family oxidoreductase n=1 Tax=Zunongwangia sp. HRR-M8 TaxID=3015170 RepID=UPI0022DE92CC|nr:SDR family oxidoreductase [Zunongwangia sp. HRR-M8]WBL21387.1 SDR family oxidoreductase [Zunongwangia sp. HRR-M8]